MVKAAVAGLRMGENHARALANISGVRLAAVCDLNPDVAERVAGSCATNGEAPRAYTDYAAMLGDVSPEIVGIATPNRFHHEMTLQAVAAGARAVYCEKPIAVNLAEAREMAETCAAKGVALIINHQRRTGPDFEWIRRAIADGSIGTLHTIRAHCAGDLLSDGTHLIDSSLFLAGDAPWKWVFAAHHRGSPAPFTAGPGSSPSPEQLASGFDVVDGWRFGHPIENGMLTIAELENRVRLELFTGDMRAANTAYHDLELMGDKGAIRRAGDRGEHNVYRMGPAGWEAVEDVQPKPGAELIAEAYRRAVEILDRGGTEADHPMGAVYTLRGFEILMAAYESARTRTVVNPPLEQLAYPLAVELGLS